MFRHVNLSLNAFPVYKNVTLSAVIGPILQSIVLHADIKLSGHYHVVLKMSRKLSRITLRKNKQPMPCNVFG